MSFAILPDEILLKIFSYCSGSDIVNLSTLCKKFNQLKTDLNLFGKLRLVVDCQLVINEDEFAEIVLFAKGKKIKNLRLENVERGAIVTVLLPKLESFLKSLRKSVENLEIINSRINEKVLGKLVRSFLPRLIECCIKDVNVAFSRQDIFDNDYGGKYQKVRMPKLREEPHPLRVLKLIGVEGKCVKFFTAFCTHLETFNYKARHHLYRNYINPFIVRQQQLKNLRLDYTLNNGRDSEYFPNAIAPTWDEAQLNLEKFELIGAVMTNQEGARNFFEKQQNLKKLRLCFYNTVPNSVMQVICALPQLDSVRIDSSSFVQDDSSDDQEPEYWEDFDGYRHYRHRRRRVNIDLAVNAGLENHTVQQLTINDDVELAPRLIKIFPEATVIFEVARKHLEVKDHRKLKNLKCSSDSVAFNYRPQQPPADRKVFENNMLQFVRNNVRKLKSVVIGANSWLGFENFSLSQQFCRELITLLPKVPINLFNVDGKAQLEAFLPLSGHQAKVLIFNKSREEKEDEPPTKKLKLED